MKYLLPVFPFRKSLLGMTAKETQQLKRRSLRLASKKSAKNGVFNISLSLILKQYC